MTNHDNLQPSAVVVAHRQSAALTRCYPHAQGWQRALAWWQHAAALAPALPLGLAADVGMLLAGNQGSQNGTRDQYAAFLHTAANTPAVRTAGALPLSDTVIAALLAHLAQDAPVPPAYRLPLAAAPDAVAQELATALTTPPAPPAGDTYLPALLKHLLTRLHALAPADIRFLHLLGGAPLGVAALADLRALTTLLTLPPLTHAVLDAVLAFLPALAETPGPRSSQTYAVDGISGLARHGSLDSIVPTEWALPDDLLAYRYFNAELLYYGREKPPERRDTLLLILLQSGHAMAGDPDRLGRAAALALARAATRHALTVQFCWCDRTLHPPQGLTTPQEVAALLQHQGHTPLDLARVLTQVVPYVQAQARDYARVSIPMVR